MFQLNTILIHDPSWPRAFMLKKKRHNSTLLRTFCAGVVQYFCNRNKETAQTNEKKKGRKGGREKNKEETIIYMHFAMFLAQLYAPFGLTYRFGLGAWLFLSLNGILQMERSFISFGNTY